jgi:hypothetical protein
MGIFECKCIIIASSATIFSPNSARISIYAQRYAEHKGQVLCRMEHPDLLRQEQVFIRIYSPWSFILTILIPSFLYFSAGESIFHFMGCSTFAEYTVIAEISAAKVNKQADLKKMSLLGCGVATGGERYVHT